MNDASVCFSFRTAGCMSCAAGKKCDELLRIRTFVASLCPDARFFHILPRLLNKRVAYGVRHRLREVEYARPPAQQT